jgi:hypothetical protein
VFTIAQVTVVATPAFITVYIRDVSTPCAFAMQKASHESVPAGEGVRTATSVEQKGLL